MKRALVSDIHGNLDALQNVLSDIRSRGIETIFCLGDVIGYGPEPQACIDAVMDFDLCILGNHDQAALFDPEGFSSTAERAIFWTRTQLECSEPNNDDQKRRWRFLAELPRTHQVDEYLFVHGSTRNPLNEYVFPEDIYNRRKMEKIFSLVPHYCFQGHTHIPGVFTEDFRFLSPSEINFEYTFSDEKTMVNVGSVGQPRDGDPRSSYVILDDETNSIEFRRVPYDFTVTSKKIYDIPELDKFLGDRLHDGK
ncbi:MAG: metallophosphoesterase family protein [Planctomycetota bacterium]|nr:metallophosphoesterase family protein [Planctomycetota bacterium]